MKKFILAFLILVSSFSNINSYSSKDYKIPRTQVQKALDTEQDAYNYLKDYHLTECNNLPIGIPVDTVGLRRISDLYGMRKHPILGVKMLHKGIDFSGVKGTPVYATAKGTVSEVRWSVGYGKIVVVDHGGEVFTMYAHLQKSLVKVGDFVEAHQQIAKLGNTGWSTGPHLHYEIRVNRKPINPLSLLFKDINVSEKEIFRKMINQTRFKQWKTGKLKSLEAVPLSVQSF